MALVPWRHPAHRRNRTRDEPRQRGPHRRPGLTSCRSSRTAEPCRQPPGLPAAPLLPRDHQPCVRTHGSCSRERALHPPNLARPAGADAHRPRGRCLRRCSNNGVGSSCPRRDRPHAPRPQLCVLHAVVPDSHRATRAAAEGTDRSRTPTQGGADATRRRGPRQRSSDHRCQTAAGIAGGQPSTVARSPTVSWRAAVTPTQAESAVAQVGDVAGYQVRERHFEHLRQREQRPEGGVRRHSGSRLALLVLLVRIASEAGAVCDFLLAQSRAITSLAERRREALNVGSPGGVDELVSPDHSSSVARSTDRSGLVRMA